VGDDEPAEDEEQVDAQRTGRDQRTEHVDGRGDAVEAGEVEVEQHDPGRRDDPQPGQRRNSAGRERPVARPGGAWGRGVVIVTIGATRPAATRDG
jgi:hypothetical protein